MIGLVCRSAPAVVVADLGEPGSVDAGVRVWPHAANGCAIWGVLNVTPDSFSDGGAFLHEKRALAWAEAMLEAGAHVIDVGGESTRPRGQSYGNGAEPVSTEQELQRVLPVIQVLTRKGVAVSVDTTKAEVAQRACDLGVRYVNDVSCGRSEALLEVVARANVEIVLMHNRGRGEQTGGPAHYGNVVVEVCTELQLAVERATRAGIAPSRIWIDPGIGFAKSAHHSAALLAHTDALVATGFRVLVGPSRKSFIGQLAKLPDGALPTPNERLGGTAAAVALAVMLGAHAVRVHDVMEMRQAAHLAASFREARR